MRLPWNEFCSTVLFLSFLLQSFEISQKALIIINIFGLLFLLLFLLLLLILWSSTASHKQTHTFCGSGSQHKTHCSPKVATSMVNPLKFDFYCFIDGGAWRCLVSAYIYIYIYAPQEANPDFANSQQKWKQKSLIKLSISHKATGPPFIPPARTTKQIWDYLSCWESRETSIDSSTRLCQNSLCKIFWSWAQYPFPQPFVSSAAEIASAECFEPSLRRSATAWPSPLFQWAVAHGNCHGSRLFHFWPPKAMAGHRSPAPPPVHRCSRAEAAPRGHGAA